MLEECVCRCCVCRCCVCSDQWCDYAALLKFKVTSKPYFSSSSSYSGVTVLENLSFFQNCPSRSSDFSLQSLMLMFFRFSSTKSSHLGLCFPIRRVPSVLTFRHRASSILGQAFRYSPENAFYIFNQQIYFII